jgi:hypothetical protein
MDAILVDHAFPELIRARAPALMQGRFDEVVAALAREVERSGPDGLARLKRLARGGAEAFEVDPWRIEVVLARASAGLRGKTTAPLLRATLPRLGLAEPSLELRVYAIARAWLEAAMAGREPPAELAAVRGGRLVGWYLSGEHEPKPARSPSEQRALAGSARVVCTMLEPFGLLTAASATARRAHAEALWAGVREHALDPFTAELDDGWEGAQDRLERARGLAAVAVRGDEVKTQAIELLAALAHAGPPLAPLAALGRWCADAMTAGLVGAVVAADRRLRSHTAAAARRLCSELPALLSRAPVSLSDAHPGFLFWRAVTLLARERSDAGAAADLGELAAAAAETGSLSRARAADLAALTAILGEPRALAFVTRLAVTTARHHQIPAARVWRHGLQGLAAASPIGALLERWWSSAEVGDVGADEAIHMTRLCAAGELSREAGAGACAAWWELPEQALFAGEDGPAIARLASRLSAPAPAAAGERRVCLSVDELAGRHGEAYLLIKAFGVEGGSVAALVDDDLFPRRFDQTRELQALRASLDALRRAAASGPPPVVRVAELREAVGALASRRFWSELERAVGDAGVELAVADPALPWELAPVGEALALTAPTFRRRGGPADRAAWRTPERLVVAIDPDDPAARDEAAAIRAAVTLPVEVVSSVAALRAALPDCQLLHFAGHQGPAHDGTPALWLGDGGLPLRELCDAVHDAPPSLLFLHGCSTLRASRVERDGGAEQLVFGALEPLLGTRVPVIAGTLWDVSPPDERFAATFYTELAGGAHPVAAMHAARRAVAASLAWAASWPAYVIASP